MSDSRDILSDKSPEELCELINSGKLPAATVKDSQTPSSQYVVLPATELKMEVPSLPPPVNPIHSDDPFDGFDIQNPVELLMVFDPKIASGEVHLHPWQIQFMLDFANSAHNKDIPFQAAVQACNGSGKDKYINAACSVWLCMRYMEALCPITSSSGDQLDNQTSVHIDRLCNAINAKFGMEIWKVQYRYYELQHKRTDGTPAPSIIKLFATDEAGKAEGYHPVEAGKKMAIFTNETKSIPPEILEAIERCTGFTHRVDTSSPGLQAGYFFDICTSGVPRETVDNIKSLDSTQVIVYKVDYYKCPHITESEASRMAAKLTGGRDNPVFRSSMLAEFSSAGERVVVKSEYAWKCKKTPPIWEKEAYNTGGLDLSDGGAETVLSIRNGNKLLKEIPFNISDELGKIVFLEQQFRENGLNHEEALIFGDFTGIGAPTLKMLRARGWKNIRFVDSRNKAAQPKTYANRATELFFNMALLTERWEIDISVASQKTMQQLVTRYYKITTENKHALLSKQEQRSRGYPSPDRADALNLCFWNYKSTKVPSIVDKVPFNVEDEETKSKNEIAGDFDLNSWSKRELKPKVVEYENADDLSELKEAISDYNKRTRLLNVN